MGIRRVGDLTQLAGPMRSLYDAVCGGSYLGAALCREPTVFWDSGINRQNHEMLVSMTSHDSSCIFYTLV